MRSISHRCHSWSPRHETQQSVLRMHFPPGQEHLTRSISPSSNHLLTKASKSASSPRFSPNRQPLGGTPHFFRHRPLLFTQRPHASPRRGGVKRQNPGTSLEMSTSKCSASESGIGQFKGQLLLGQLCDLGQGPTQLRRVHEHFMASAQFRLRRHRIQESVKKVTGKKYCAVEKKIFK